MPAKEQCEQRQPRSRKTLRSFRILCKARHEQVQVLARIGKVPFGGGLSQMVNVKVILQSRCTQGDNTRTHGGHALHYCFCSLIKQVILQKIRMFLRPPSLKLMCEGAQGPSGITNLHSRGGAPAPIICNPKRVGREPKNKGGVAKGAKL